MEEQNIIKFYRIANTLKNKIRTGWIEIGISKERLESVAEHIYGCLILAIGINSEHKLDLDMYKVIKMLTLHELEETLMPDYTLRANITREEKNIKGKECVKKVVKNLKEAKQLEELIDEFNERKTKEAVFCYHIDKIECDFQAKLYDIEGYMDYEEAKKDLEYYGERADEIDRKSKTASDFWIEYDRPRYEDDKIFKDLLDEIQKISN